MQKNQNNLNTMLRLGLLLIAGIALSGCGAPPTPAPASAQFRPAVKAPEPGQERTLTQFIPVAMPGQMMPVPKDKKPKELTGVSAIKKANILATQKPVSGKYINSIMTYDYMPGALYQIYCEPLNVTDIEFGPNEHIISVAAGDTLRWQASKTYSGIGDNRREHLVIKPIQEDLVNSLIVTTDRYTYHLMLHSTKETYMASVKWNYPQAANGVLMPGFGDSEDQQPADVSQQGPLAGVNPLNMDFNYRIRLVNGPKPDWMPIMVFNDGKKTYIQFPKHMEEAPTLFIGYSPEDSQLVNYRMKENYYIIDGVFRQAQLRLGQRSPIIVSIEYIVPKSGK